MESTAFESYAELLVEMVGLQEGQGLAVAVEPVNWPVLLAVAEEAYKRGAKYVQPVVGSTALHRVRVDNSEASFLDFVPRERAAWQEQFLEEGWAYISIKSPDDPDIFAGIDPDRHSAVTKAIRTADHPWRRRVLNDEYQWLVAAAPTPKWAAKILDTTPSREAQLRLWQILKPILRLNQENPGKFWREQSETLQRRSKLLNDLDLRKVRFTGPGTELTIGLRPEALWVGGDSRTPGGVAFLPNLPTEEVFTAPDLAATEGTVRATKPVTVLGDLVEGAEFTFRGGKVVKARADKGQESLERFLDIDDGSRYLGEVALVDTESPIFQSGYIFYNTLLDENAACHIALGSAYPGCLQGGERMSGEELQAVGANRSLQHADFMIGSAEVDVSGVTASGRSVEILREGRFVLPGEAL